MNKILSDASLSVDAIHNVSIINMNGQIIASSDLDKIGIFANMFENDVGSGSFGTKHYDFFQVIRLD